VLEDCMRDHLNEIAERRIAVLDPVKLIIDNYPEGQQEDCFAPNHPQKPDLGKRVVPLSRELWIEREDFSEQPPKGFFRLFPGNQVRLKYGHVIECVGATRDAQGHLTEIHARLIPNTKSGTPGADSVKVKGVITWVSAHDGVAAEVRLYDRLFNEAQPDAGGRDFLSCLNPNSLQVVQAIVEPSLAQCAPDDKFQFERHGYFVADRVDHGSGQPGSQPVFNRITTLKDSWK